jgi:hypothetical protein
MSIRRSLPNDFRLRSLLDSEAPHGQALLAHLQATGHTADTGIESAATLEYSFHARAETALFSTPDHRIVPGDANHVVDTGAVIAEPALTLELSGVPGGGPAGLEPI